MMVSARKPANPKISEHLSTMVNHRPAMPSNQPQPEPPDLEPGRPWLAD